MKEVDTKAIQAQTDAANHAEDRRSKEKLAMIDLAQSELVHKDRLSQDQQKAQVDAAFRAQQSSDNRRRHAIDTAMAAQQANKPIEEI